MKDLYQTLGLSKDASLGEIKKAYRNLAIHAHPDKGGNSERMAFINEAYEILSDPTKRQEFNEKWKIFQECDSESPNAGKLFEQIKSTSTVSYSRKFLEEHNSLVQLYSVNPLKPGSSLDVFEKHFSGIYQFVHKPRRVNVFHDIFNFIEEKTARFGHPTIIFHAPKEKLTPSIAVKIFTEFLAGKCYGNNLITATKYLQTEISSLSRSSPYAPELSLFEGIFDILSMANKMPKDKNALIFSIKKITDFAKQLDEASLSCLIPLFYNSTFKNLFSQALHLHWEANDCLFDKTNLQKSDGQLETKELLEILKVQLSQNSNSKNLIEVIHLVKLLYNYEKDSCKTSKTSKDYREKAFHLLNWIPPLIENANRQIIINIFLQIGIKFQQASRLENKAALKMADEQLALKMYLLAIGIAHHSAPNIEMYANIQSLKYISQFQFQNSTLNEVIPALQTRTLELARIYPFFEEFQTNVAFLKQGNQIIILMRRLLNSMIDIIKSNKNSNNPIDINHSAATVFYQAYEGCLKHWFQEEYDPAIEQKFRLDLMEELLKEEDWNFLDVDKNLSSPWVMVERDQDGWINIEKSLPDNSAFEVFRSIRGAEINNKTGEILFFLEQWDANSPDYEKSFTLFDMQEMLEKNISGAIFSLDPVDPSMPYHPFNQMRFAPSQLAESEFLNTMLLTDYTLKFLTTKQEVQSKYPYANQPIENMIQHLPEHLKRIINNFNSEKHSAAMHRFWIEAEEIDISLSDDQNENTTQIGLGDVRMVVKKHKIERDIHGELKDVGNESEGWPIYILTPTQMKALNKGSRTIEGHAIIYLNNQNKFVFWENNEVLLEHKPKNISKLLVELRKQQLSDNKQVIQNMENMHFLYNLTTELSKQTKLPHRYTPEFIFAIEFTAHYDEFAKYMPEFGRLKQLSKISSLTRIFTNIREDNKEKIQALDRSINTNFKAPKASSTEAYKQYQKSYLMMKNSISNQFKLWQNDFSKNTLSSQRRDELNTIKNNILRSFNAHELGELLKDYLTQYVNPITYLSFLRLWRTGRFTRTEEEISLTYRKPELYRIFTPILSKIFPHDDFSFYGKGRISSLISSFVKGDAEPLVSILAEHDQKEIINKIKVQFCHGVSTEMIGSALNGVDNALQQIIREEVCSQFKKIIDSKEKMESGFVKVGLGRNAEPIDLEGKCFWVPASVRHEVKEDETARHMFFVYGGVNIQPKLNISTNQNISQIGRSSTSRSAENRAIPYTAAQINQGRSNIPQVNRKEALMNERIARSHHEQVPRTANAQVKGQAGEAAAIATLKRAGYQVLPSKISHNQGFDHVGVLKNPDGSIKEVLIVESKYSADGKFRLGKTVTKGQQMSKAWIEKTINKMQRSQDPAIQETAKILRRNEDKWTLRGNVLDPKGINSWRESTRIVNNQHQTNAQPRAPPKRKANKK